MSSVSLVSAAFCQGEAVGTRLAETMGYELVDDRSLIATAAGRFPQSARRFEYALSRGGRTLEKFFHQQRHLLAGIKLTLADFLGKDNGVFWGLAGHLIPMRISHILKVCLIAERAYRIRAGVEGQGLSERAALRALQKEDEKAGILTQHLFEKGPWERGLYDMVIPVDKKGVGEALNALQKNLKAEVLRPTSSSLQAVEDFRLAAEVEASFGKKGEGVTVEAMGGHITLTINRHVLRLRHFEAELTKLATDLAGVRGVETRVGPEYHRSNIYRNHDMGKPSRFVLVDDEREFVETLSERLSLKDIDTAVVYDGMGALDLVEREQPPEVMVLDLKMPGIDGLGVLRRIKQEHPDVEVIILSSKDTPEDREACMRLGAFAYLKKPVDVDILAHTMRSAYEKIRHREGNFEK